MDTVQRARNVDILKKILVPCFRQRFKYVIQCSLPSYPHESHKNEGILLFKRAGYGQEYVFTKLYFIY